MLVAISVVLFSSDIAHGKPVPSAAPSSSTKVPRLTALSKTANEEINKTQKFYVRRELLYVLIMPATSLMACAKMNSEIVERKKQNRVVYTASLFKATNQQISNIH